MGELVDRIGWPGLSGGRSRGREWCQAGKREWSVQCEQVDWDFLVDQGTKGPSWTYHWDIYGPYDI